MASIKDILKVVGAVLSAILSRRRWEILTDLTALAIPIVETIAGIDLDRDGREGGKAEILEAAEIFGGKVRKYFVNADGTIRDEVVDNLPESNLKKWIGVSRLIKELHEAGAAMPRLGRLDSSIQLAFEAKDDADTAE